MNNPTVDPNSGLFGEEEEKSEEEILYGQLFGKNPRRVSAMKELWFEELMESVDSEELPEEAKRELIFKMTANAVLDMVMECTTPDTTEELSYVFDSYIGVALTNKKFGVDLFKEQQKALLSVDPKKFADNEEYEKAIRDFEEEWWSIPQPKLGKRNPNDAIVENMKRYGLME